MKCPKCYGKVDKKSNRCTECGFVMTSLQKGTFSGVKKARKEYRHEDIYYTSILPKEINKKTLLMLAICFGYLGVHSFYAKRFWRGLFSAIVFPCTIFSVCVLLGYIVLPFNIMFTNGQIGSMLFAISVLMWVYDIIAIASNRYKVAVVIENEK